MRLQIYLCFAQCLIFCNQLCITTALIGSKVRQANQNEFKFVACIMKRPVRNLQSIRDHICTGTAISKTDILSSEHCFTNRPIDSFQATVGSVDIALGKIYYPAQVITFDQWSRLKRKSIEYEENDVAIMKLTQKISNEITPARISYKTDNALYGEGVVMAGWGISNNLELTTKLEIVHVNVLSKTLCEVKISQLNKGRLFLEPRLLCSASVPFALLQFGDSGGPLLRKGALIGVNKGSAPLPEVSIHPDKVNIHFNVNYYKKFISYVVQKKLNLISL